MLTTSRFIFFPFACGLFLLGFGGFVSAAEFTPITHLHVAQEISKHSGVLVSRPQRIHTQIVDLIQNHQIRSLEDYARWLGNNIRYQGDGTKDLWSAPEQTLRKKTGDCEDYALLNTSVMQVLGYEPHFLALVRNGRRAHAICTFKQNGYFLWFDNAKLKRSSATSLQQLAQEISDQYHYSSLLEFDLQKKNWNVIYKRS